MISLELFRTAVAQLPIQQFPARAFSKVSQGLNSLCCEAVDALLPAKCVFQIPMFTKKFYPHLRPFSLLWGVGGERGRERWQKHQLVAFLYFPYVPWPGTWPVTLQSTGWRCNLLSHTGQGSNPCVLMLPHSTVLLIPTTPPVSNSLSWSFTQSLK